jgi:hypothetical protein
VRAWALVALGLVGCGAAQSPIEAPGEPFLALSYASEVGALYRLVAIRATLDGVLIFERAIEVPAEGDYEPIATPLCLARMRLAPGSHRVQVDASYSYFGYGIFAHLRFRPLEFHADEAFEFPTGAAGLIVRAIGVDEYEATHAPDGLRGIRWTFEPTMDAASGCMP